MVKLRRNVPRGAIWLQIKTVAIPLLCRRMPSHPVACPRKEIFDEGPARLGNMHKQKRLDHLFGLLSPA
eukprot:8102463-Prorocentrum_lima.AAC.1